MIVNLNSNKTEIVVVGGGTAGWITALYVKRCYPEVNITLIESSDIGILGAGEGTTPQFTALLDELQLTSKDILEFANGTIKSGIKFTNWNGDGESYYHGFNIVKDLNYETVFNINYSQDSLIALDEISKGNNLNKIEFTANACEKNAIIIVKNENHVNKTISYDRLGDFALHFNAVMLADFLKKVGIERGIKVIDGIVEKINSDSDGNITYLTLKDGTNVTCDFVFDCTGFKRLIIGKHFNSEWKSYKEYLPLNRAMPFFTKIDDSIPPYTESIAMKYGWVWKIPLQDRYGCGYVFDSNSITDEQAAEEIKTVFRDVNIPGKTFSFEPGAYKQQWKKNCIAIGLAAGFVEPLEATNIWVAILSLRTLLTRIKGVTERDETQISLYNDSLYKVTEDVLTFLHFHYRSLRADTPFWQNFKTKCKVPEQVQTLIDANYDVTAVIPTIKDNLFVASSWVQVGAGINFFNKEEAGKSFNSLTAGIRGTNYNMLREIYLTNVRNLANRCIDHKTLVNIILATDEEKSAK